MYVTFYFLLLFDDPITGLFSVRIYVFCVLALSQKCLELLSMLSAKERRDFQRTQPSCSLRTDGSALEVMLVNFNLC